MHLGVFLRASVSTIQVVAGVLVFPVHSSGVELLRPELIGRRKGGIMVLSNYFNEE